MAGSELGCVGGRVGVGRGGAGGEVKQNDIILLGIGSLCDGLVVGGGKLLSSRHLQGAEESIVSMNVLVYHKIVRGA